MLDWIGLDWIGSDLLLINKYSSLDFIIISLPFCERPLAIKKKMGLGALQLLCLVLGDLLVLSLLPFAALAPARWCGAPPGARYLSRCRGSWLEWCSVEGGPCISLLWLMQRMLDGVAAAGPGLCRLAVLMLVPSLLSSA